MKKCILSLMSFVAFCLMAANARDAAPVAFVVCALKGDELDTACDYSEKRLREAGYEVHRIDGPDFPNQRPFKEALRTAAKPLVLIHGHGGVSDGGFHHLFLGRDGNKRSYPTHLVIEELHKLNGEAQIFVESCQSGQLRKEASAPGGPVGVSTRADELSPAERAYTRDGRRTRNYHGAVFKPVFDLLNLAPNDFKYWSGGKCEIGGDELRKYLSWRLNGGAIDLQCWVRGYEQKKRREPAEIRKDEAICEKKLEELRTEPAVHAFATEEYELEVKCAKFKPGETLRIYGFYRSPAELEKELREPANKDAGEPREIRSVGYSSYFPDGLQGKECQVQPGFRSKRYTAAVRFEAKRDGRQAYVYNPGKLDKKAEAEILPFVARWKKDLPISPEDERNKDDSRGVTAFGDAPVTDGVATPDFGDLVVRHASCVEGDYVRRTRSGAGLSIREHAGDVK